MKKQLTIISLLVCLISCTQNPNLDDTIFIPDPNDSRLPAYSEKGYNSFGAIYERKYFLADKNIVPCKITYKDGLVHFMISGYMDRSSDTSLTFSFPFQTITDYTGLLALHQKSFNLADTSCKVTFNQGWMISSVMSGNLNFKRAQLLRIDEKEDRVILSGTFDLKFLNNGQLENISYGRFDFGINKDFYSFEL